MVVLSLNQQQSTLIQTCKQTPFFNKIPAIDLLNPNAKALIVDAFHDFGFFKLINHGVPIDCMSKLEEASLKFFNLPLSDKNRATPLGYGNRKIGPNGDMGWVEYLLFSTSKNHGDHFHSCVLDENHETFREAVSEYVSSVKRMTCEVLDLVAGGLGIEPRNVISEMIRDEESDCLLRVNHYPPCSELQELVMIGENVIGFGEHTDPQILSVLRSNNISGLEICLRDGTWVSVPPDQNSFFISVGDCLQVMTNGRFKSVRHRVSANTLGSRISMIYFGGPRPSDKIAPLPSLLLQQGEKRFYREFTWTDYKKSAYSSRLGDNRLGLFEKYSVH